jgi:hypothetical protein
MNHVEELLTMKYRSGKGETLNGKLYGDLVRFCEAYPEFSLDSAAPVEGPSYSLLKEGEVVARGRTWYHMLKKAKDEMGPRQAKNGSSFTRAFATFLKDKK